MTTATNPLMYNQVFSKIQTSFPNYIKSNDVNMLEDVFDSKLSESVKFYVEVAVRHYIIGILKVDGEADLEQIKLIVKICVEGARHDMCFPTLPILVLSDAFDSITIKQCEVLFEFVESCVSILKEPLFFTLCKNQVLRMCNDVLRRLSRTQNTIFCGRILLFLARFFPFSERSGLNLISEFNLENVTVFTDSEIDADMETDSTEKDEKDDKKSPSIDYTLYTKFWALQDFFRNPIQCYQKAPWKIFTKYSDDVLEAFGSFKLDNVQGTKTSDHTNQKNVSTQSPEEQGDDFFPKYLSSQKLLDLQFSDSNFRRFILVQMLIHGQYLTSNIKFKQETLNEDQLAWVKEMQEKTYSLIEETPPNGKEFAEIVRCIMKREEVWSEWKNGGCPEIKKPGLSLKRKNQDAQQNGKDEKMEIDSQPPKKKEKRKIGDLIREAESKNRFVMGNAEMTRLWNICPNNFESCQKDVRDFVPSLETYFTPAVEQVQGKAQVKEGEKFVNDSNFGWRALRLLASKSPHFFTNSGNSIATLPEYLTNMIKKVAKDLPSLVTEEAKEDIEEKEEEIAVLTPDDDPEKEDDVEEVDDEENEREKLNAIDEAERKILAKALADDDSGDAWKKLGIKIGFDEDELDWFIQGKSLVDGIEIMLERWVENEGDEANKENLIYTLDGLKLQSVVKSMYG